MTKIGVVGLGAMGAPARWRWSRGFARDLVLVNRTRAPPRRSRTDMGSRAPLHDAIAVRDSDYADLAAPGW